MVIRIIHRQAFPRRKRDAPMDFMANLFLSPKGKKTAQYSKEHKKYQDALRRNPGDHGLQAQFVKFSLLSHFTLEGIPEAHLAQALELYEKVAKTDLFDPQVFYLAGRYWQGKDDLKAQNVYLAAIQRFNRHVAKNPGMKSELVETTYAIALNFVTLQFGQNHPDLERFFRTIRRSYPLHNKRVELENELRKASPDHGLVKRLAQELKDLKEASESLRPKKAPKD